MISAWTKHIKDDSEKERFVKNLYGSKITLDRLSGIMAEMESRVKIKELDYSNPNWAYHQAHHNGYRECLDSIQTLINLDQQKEHLK